MWFFIIFVPMSEEKNINCSFCGRDKQDTNVLIAGINSHICDSCIEQAVGIVHSEKEGKDHIEMKGSQKVGEDIMLL